jgi:hypothetical protein
MRVALVQRNFTWTRNPSESMAKAFLSESQRNRVPPIWGDSKCSNRMGDSKCTKLGQRACRRDAWWRKTH